MELLENNIGFISGIKPTNTLLPSQYKQIIAQIENHTHKNYSTDIIVSNDIVLKQFRVHKNVMRPEIMTSLLFAKFLARNRELFVGKRVLDMGCGSGILGVTAALLGANEVVFSDLMESCCFNTRKNIELYGLESKTEVIKGDLFQNISGDYDLIMFNHPFFAADPQKEIPITFSMMDGGRLLHQFLSYSSKFTSKITLPFFELAGTVNDPEEHAERYGFNLSKKVLAKHNGSSIQIGKIKFCVFDHTDSI